VDRGALQRLAVEQGGLFTVDQARACGYSAKVIRRRIALGEWRPASGRVLTATAGRLSPRLTDRAVSLAVPDAVLTAVSAARIHGLPLPGPDWRWSGSCALTSSRISLGPAAVRLLRDPVAARDVLLIDGMLVAGRQRAVFDLLRTVPVEVGRDLLDTALQRRWLSLSELAARVRAHCGRRDAPRLVDLVQYAAAGAQSAAERLAIQVLRRAGITGWAANRDIHNARGEVIARGDLVFALSRLVVEIDGRAHHVTPEQFQRDRDRQNRLVAAGWTVLRFTWHDLTRRPDRVGEAVKIAIGYPKAPRTGTSG
jgi:very-short-patch-repair endonuclease